MGGAPELSSHYLFLVRMNLYDGIVHDKIILHMKFVIHIVLHVGNWNLLNLF